MSLLDKLNRRFLLRYRLEYLVGLVILHLMRGLSPAFAWRSMRAVGRLAWRRGARRKVILTNLRQAFPELSEERRIQIGRRTAEHLASLVVDVVFQRRMLTRPNLFRRVEMQGWVRRYLDDHGVSCLGQRARGILFVTGHLGNWEASAGCFSLLGVPIAPVYRTPQNPWLAKLLLRIRLDSHTKFIERRGAVREMVQHLEQGGNIGFLFDQEALHGIPVPFFGHPAATHKTPAVLARDLSTPIFFGVLLRRGDFLQYEARGELIEIPAASSDREADLLAIMSDLSRRLEQEIRKNPDQYLWTHRRWKRVGVHGDDLMVKRS